MRGFFAFLVIGLSLGAQAQFDWGFGVGAFAQQLSTTDGYHDLGRLHNFKPFPVNPAIFFRLRSKLKANPFIELDWRYREFSASFSNGGLGSGTNAEVDIKLLQTYLTVGPEWVMGKHSLRFGVQFGFITAGSVVGTSQGWSMITGRDPQNDIDSSARSYLNGGARLLLGGRFHLASNGRWTWILDPFLSPSIVAMHHDDNKIKGTDMGIRLLLMRTHANSGSPTQETVPEN